ncbi:MAG: hypothetical protein HGA85_06215 [Nanoarchaeota archaeon]|nr:hypothetical protein [Nanoarchaeota archaeon]
MDEKKVKSMVADGYLDVRIILEIVGKPKEHVKETLAEHLKNMKKQKLVLVNEHIEQPELSDNDLFTAFAELELLFKDSKALLDFCFDYMPTSVEILEPEELAIKNTEFTSFINDLQGRLHGLNNLAIQTRENNIFYIKTTAVLLRNFLIVLLSDKKMTIDEISPYMGVKKEDILKVIDVLVKEGKLGEDKGKYFAKAK